MKEGLNGRPGVTYVLVLSSVSTQRVSLILPLLVLSPSTKLPGCNCSSSEDTGLPNAKSGEGQYLSYLATEGSFGKAEM